MHVKDLHKGLIVSGTEKLSGRARNRWIIFILNHKREPNLYDLCSMDSCGRKTILEIINWRLNELGLKP